MPQKIEVAKLLLKIAQASKEEQNLKEMLETRNSQLDSIQTSLQKEQ